MSRKYKIRDQGQVYFVTFTVIHWLDVFIRKEYRDIFLESIRYCQQHKGLEVHYLYSSAVNYAGLAEKLLDVILV